MMRRSPLLALALVLQPFIMSTAHAQAPAGCEGCALMEAALKAVQNLSPGSPRAKVELDFRPDGGLQPFQGPTRYVFKKCPLVKVDIEFTHFDGEQDGLPSDQIINVSRPYLEYPAYD
jgi:hypothetical protein